MFKAFGFRGLGFQGLGFQGLRVFIKDSRSLRFKVLRVSGIRDSRDVKVLSV